MRISLKTAHELEWWLKYWIPSPKWGGTWLHCPAGDGRRFKSAKKYRRHFRKEHYDAAG